VSKLLALGVLCHIYPLKRGMFYWAGEVTDLNDFVRNTSQVVRRLVLFSSACCLPRLQDAVTIGFPNILKCNKQILTFFCYCFSFFWWKHPFWKTHVCVECPQTRQRLQTRLWAYLNAVLFSWFNMCLSECWARFLFCWVDVALRITQHKWA